MKIGARDWLAKWTMMTDPRSLLALAARAARPALTMMLAFATVPAFAAFQIAYTATDLADEDPAKDLWVYDYVLTGHDFAVDDAIEILFPKGYFSDMDPVPAPGWWVAALPDDVLLPNASIVAQAVYPLSSPLSLSVRFSWLGADVMPPGSQQFSLFAGGLDDPVQGATTAAGAPPPVEPIPEPAAAFLLLAGVLLLGASGMRRMLSRAAR
jgi:hypothetical protein